MDGANIYDGAGVGYLEPEPREFTLWQVFAGYQGVNVWMPLVRRFVKLNLKKPNSAGDCGPKEFGPT